jgi:hypothetical protein
MSIDSMRMMSKRTICDNSVNKATGDQRPLQKDKTQDSRNMKQNKRAWRIVLVEAQKVGTAVPIPVAKKVDFGRKRRPMVKKTSTK